MFLMDLWVRPIIYKKKRPVTERFFVFTSMCEV